MNMERINPLDLPEIIMTVGRCLPLWKHSDNLGFYDFNPKHLLSFTLVNKTWRSALLPVIWYVYNGFVMRHVPKPIILKYSVHFRLFFGDRSFPGQVLSKNIKSLVISWWDQGLLDLVEGNAESLEYLSWKGANSTGGTGGRWPSPDYGLLMRMAPTLKELHLSHWTLSGQEVARFLGACKRLHRLDLASIDWIDPVRECNFTAASPYCRPVSSDTAGQGLTDLNLDISTPKEDAFADLLRYSCPDLERFTLYSESAADSRRLTPILRAHCRKLVGLDYVTRFSSSLDRRDYLSDSEYADLVLAVSDNVRQIKLDIPWLDAQLTRAIVLRPLTLQSLNLRFYERRMTPPTSSFSPSFPISSSPPSSSSSSSSSLFIRDAENLGQIILQHCTNLRDLSLFFNPHSMGPEETLKLVEKPWACLDLRSLTLADISIGLTTISTTTPHTWQGGIDETATLPSSRTLSPPSSSSTFPQFPQGPGLQPYHWQLAAAAATVPNSVVATTMTPPNNSSQDAQMRYGTLAKQRLFEQIRRLSQLARLSLNHVAYSLDGEGLTSTHRSSR
ncbi:hypothetical protein EC957_006585 [Mortierella hygrophila]|uniref:Uncharacterized protein n=1 Tax=Mortierella hygrophila TaxID=979708 RepID=A0A9P6K8V1_9FUNG|nr:hypothetical protein EC957_006585 [Mortierella hygrophila]